MKEYKVESIVSNDMISADKQEKNTEENTTRTKLKNVGKKIIKGLIAGGSVAGLVTALTTLPATLTTAAAGTIALTAGSLIMKLIDAGEDLRDFLTPSPEPMGA